MRMSRRVAGAAAGAALALGVAAPAATAAPAAPAAAATPTALGAAPAASTHHHRHPAGTRSLVAVLTADKNGFDRNRKDFDILTAAVKAVLAAKPDSPVGVLANGKVRVTAFIPNDRAFRLLVRDLTGKTLRPRGGRVQGRRGTRHPHRGEGPALPRRSGGHDPREGRRRATAQSCRRLPA